MGRLLLISVIALSVTANAAIDFTPVVEEYTSQGFVYRKVTLKGEKGVIRFVSPLGWNVRGTKDLLQLYPPNQSFAEATMSARTVDGPASFDSAMIEALEQQVLGTAPPNSQAARIVKHELNPVPMGANSSLEIVISYDTLGRTFQKSVIIVQNADQQLVFRLSAPKEDFDTLNQAFRRSIGSWQSIEPAASVATASSSQLPLAPVLR
jgi:hypothetical protein